MGGVEDPAASRSDPMFISPALINLKGRRQRAS